MNKDNISNEDMFECKMYITDLETNKKSKEIDVSDLVFNDYIEFEFGNYEDEDYGTLPYKDFKFFINDYSVTFYSPQYHKATQELEKYKNIIDESTKELEKLLPLCIMPNNTLIHATEKSKTINKTLKILKGE